MKTRLLTSRLAAQAGIRQVETIARADAAAAAVDREIRSLWRELLTVLREPQGYARDYQRAAEILRRLPAVVLSSLQDRLGKLYAWNHRETAKTLSDTLPLPHLRAAAMLHEARLQPTHPESTRLLEAGFAALSSGTYGFAVADLIPEPTGTEAEQREQLADLLFPPPTQTDAARALAPVLPEREWAATVGDRDRRTAEQLARGIADGMAQGKTQQQIAKDLRPFVDGSRVRARRAARTFGLVVAQQAQQDVHDQLGDLVSGFQIHATLDQNTRPWHAARSGTIYHKRPKPGEKGLDQMPNPPMEAKDASERPAGTPSVAFNCLLPGSLVQGTFVAALKAFYEGEAVELTCSSGFRLRVTANHPILTPQGFVPAKSVAQGQQLVCYVGNVHAACTHHEHDGPIPVEQVFSAIKQLSRPVSARPRSNEDLYGDATFMQGEVEIVRADRELMLRREAERFQGTQESKFVGGSTSQPGVPGFRSGPLHAVAISLSPPGLVSGRDLLGANSGIVGVEPLHQFRFGLAADLDASRYEHSGEAERFPKPVATPAASDSDFLRQLGERFAAVVTTDEVVEIRHFQFAGHVYDLQSPGGWIVADNIFISNCRCYTTPVLADLDQVTQVPAARLDFENARGELVPDPATYSDWFDRADERRRRIAVGTRRYDAVAKRTGGDVRWEHFLDPKTGDLLPAKQLEREHPGDRQSRVAKVTQQIDARRELTQRLAVFGTDKTDLPKLPRFVRHPDAQRSERLVYVDPRKLDQDWQRDVAAYVPPGGKVGPSGVKGRREGFARFLERGQAIQAPRVMLDMAGLPSFLDGRHRFSVLRDLGVELVGVMVPADQVAEFLRRYGLAA